MTRAHSTVLAASPIGKSGSFSPTATSDELADWLASNSLAEHYSRRKQYRDALTLATAKAAALLQPPPASNVLGVREESVLKAEKWTLATRLRDLRVASEKTREGINAGECSRKHDR